MLTNMFFIMCFVNSIPLDLYVISTVEMVSAGNVAKIPPQTGPKSFAANTPILITMPLNTARPKRTFSVYEIRIGVTGISLMVLTIFLTSYIMDCRDVYGYYETHSGFFRISGN